MSRIRASKHGDDVIEGLFAELQDHLNAAGDSPEHDVAGALETLGRLEKLAGLMRRTAVHSFGQFEQRVSELSLLRTVGELLSSVLDRERIAGPLAQLVEEALPCSAVILYLIDPGTGLREASCAPDPALAGVSRSLVDRHARDVAREQSSSWLAPSEESEPRVLFCPVVSQSETLGVIALFEAEPGALSEGTVHVIADFTATVLRQARLWDENRRHQASLEQAVEERTREVNEARAALSRQERIAAMGKLAASIAHEVNNPMSFLISNLARAAEFAAALETCLPELLGAVAGARLLPVGQGMEVDRVRSAAKRAQEALDGSRLTAAGSAEFREIIEETREGADRLRHVGDQLRGFAQGVAGEMELEDVNALLETAAHVASAEGGGRVAIECRSAVLPKLRCNRYQVIQVLVNLLQNAIEATESSGTVLATTCAVDGNVEVSVTDEGPGIEPGELDRIFDPFYTTKADGTGLGLSVSREIARAHGGSLEASSGPGGGVFRLRLPISERRRQGAERPA